MLTFDGPTEKLLDEAAIGRFLIVMAELEITIDRLFRIEAEIRDQVAVLISGEIRSVDRKFKLLIECAINRKCSAEFIEILKAHKRAYDPVRKYRNNLVHGAEDIKRFSSLDRAFGERRIWHIDRKEIEDFTKKAEIIMDELSILTMPAHNLYSIQTLLSDVPNFDIIIKARQGFY